MELCTFLGQGVSGRCYLLDMVLVLHVTDDFKNGFRLDIFKKIWIRLLKEYDHKKGIKWVWQSLDSISIKSPLGGVMTVGSNPTDRSKLGTKRHILTDKKGVPLSAVITSASTHDIKVVTEIIDNVVVKRPNLSSFKKERRGRRKQYQHLCFDRAYNSKSVKQAIIKRGFVPHIPHKRKRGEKKVDKEKVSIKRYPARRLQVVERTNSWHNRFRKLFTRYEKKVENYLGLLQLSCSIIIYRKLFLG